jgi:Gpi18-like mannosyltransferase
MTEPSVEPEPGESGGGTDEPGRRLRVTDLATPLLLYVATRVVQLLLIAWLAPGNGPSIKDRLLAWDGGWFVRVATEGYAHTYSYDSNGQMIGNGLAFFPGYPLLIRAVHALGTDAGIAALIVSWMASAVAAVLLYLLGADLVGRRFGLVLMLLFVTAPMSVVLSMGYSEAVFSAFVIGMFYAVRRNAFLVAGALGLGAALTRPTGLAAAVALALAAQP